MKIYIDIETLPNGTLPTDDEMKNSVPGNISKPETIAKWISENKEHVYRKRALNPYEGRILCIAYYMDEDTKGTICSDNETKVLSEFDSVLLDIVQNKTKELSLHYIGYNVRFDLRWLYIRGTFYGLSYTKYLPIKKYSERITDLMEILMFGDINNRVSLDKVCQFYNIPCKDGITGKTVYDEHLKGNYKGIAEYCMSDTMACVELHKKLGLC